MYTALGGVLRHAAGLADAPLRHGAPAKAPCRNPAKRLPGRLPKRCAEILSKRVRGEEARPRRAAAGPLEPAARACGGGSPSGGRRQGTMTVERMRRESA